MAAEAAEADRTARAGRARALLQARAALPDDHRAAAESGGAPEPKLQGEGLGRLLWIYLTLLRTRQQIVRVVRESLDLERNKEPLDQRMQRWTRAGPGVRERKPSQKPGRAA